jgi:hypothetical protein
MLTAIEREDDEPLTKQLQRESYVLQVKRRFGESCFAGQKRARHTLGEDVPAKAVDRGVPVRAAEGTAYRLTGHVTGTISEAGHTVKLLVDPVGSPDLRSPSPPARR